MGPAFVQAGLKTRIVVFDHNWDLVDYPLEVLADSQVQAYVDGAAFHCYAGNALSQTRVHATYPNENIWFTECSGGRWAPRFSENLNYFLRTVMIGNFNNWGNSVMLWNLALDEKDGPQNGGCTNCRGVVTIDQSTGEVAYNVEYYTLGHFSKFVDPGAVRIGSSPGVNRLPVNVAFINPDGSIVLVAHADRTGTFDVSWNDMHFTYTLPERAAVTFKWQGPAQP
jgi:glucosylceramidase